MYRNMTKYIDMRYHKIKELVTREKSYGEN